MPNFFVINISTHIVDDQTFDHNHIIKTQIKKPLIIKKYLEHPENYQPHQIGLLTYKSAIKIQEITKDTNLSEKEKQEAILALPRNNGSYNHYIKHPDILKNIIIKQPEKVMQDLENYKLPKYIGKEISQLYKDRGCVNWKINRTTLRNKIMLELFKTKYPEEYKEYKLYRNYMAKQNCLKKIKVTQKQATISPQIQSFKTIYGVCIRDEPKLNTMAHIENKPNPAKVEDLELYSTQIQATIEPRIVNKPKPKTIIEKILHYFK